MTSADVPAPRRQRPVPADLERMTGVLSTIAVQARRTNLGRVEDVRIALQLSRGSGLDADGWSAAERTAHQLAGSAGTFGYPAASELARELERMLAGFAWGGPAPPESAQLAEAFDLLDRLTQQLAVEVDLN